MDGAGIQRILGFVDTEKSCCLLESLWPQAGAPSSAPPVIHRRFADPFNRGENDEPLGPVHGSLQR
jgi:hypothetical protein